MMKILVTAGPTVEDIDDVRYITNRSSGKMGYAVVEVAIGRGHEVTLVTGPTSLRPPEKVTVIHVRGAAEMLAAVLENFRETDALVMAAAVADFTPERRIKGKLHKTESGPDGSLILRLVRTPDILAEIARISRPEQKVVGFSLEPAGDPDRALEKMRSKNLDAIVANDTSSFGSETGSFVLLFSDGDKLELGRASKLRAAEAVLDFLETAGGSSC